MFSVKTELKNVIFSFRSTNKEITITLLKPKTDLFTFAIYGRDFRGIPGPVPTPTPTPTPAPSSGIKVTSTIVMLLTALLLKHAV